MKRIGKIWLSMWLYFIILIGGVIVGIAICRWNDWCLQQKLFAVATVLLPLHVLEEWHVPGGFHTMYNLMAKSDKPDRYPMNQMSDMFTNLIGVMFGCAVLLAGATPFFCVMQLFLCCTEIIGHFKGGVYLLRQFGEYGKRTIYSPGMVTVLLGYIPVAIGINVSFFTQFAPTAFEFILAVLCGVMLGALSLKMPEKLFKSEATPYAYTWGDGYLDKYIRRRENVSHQQ